MTEPHRVVLASGNTGKLRELRRLFTGLQCELVSQSQLGIHEAVETGESFAENAILKARHAAALSGCPAIADDSGLEVAALNGAPGIRSARYAGEHATDAENVEKLMAELAGIATPDRSARFICVAAYLDAADSKPILCEGVWPGSIAEAPRGKGGFGYDPVFIVHDLNCTAAELDADTKNRLSHRGQAMRALLTLLKTRESDR